MNKKRTLKAIICLAAFMCSMFGMLSVSGASSVASLKEQIADLEEKRNAIKSEVNRLKAEKAPVESVKKKLDSQVENIEEQIELCSIKLEELDEEIADANAQIAANEEKLAENKELFKKRLRAIYMSGGTSEIMMVLDADNFADYLAKSQLTKTVSERDEALMEDILADIEEIRELNADIYDKIAEQEEVKKTLQAKQKELQEDLKEVNSEYYAVKKEYDDAVDNLEEYQDAIDDLYDDIAELTGIAAGQNIKFDGNFGWPVPGYYHITSHYGWRWGKLHRGTDISSSGISGKPIVSAATGKVLKSGKHYSYGNYVVINHGYYKGKLYYTLYAHMSKTPLVKVGQHVNKGQTIGYVGSTGNSTGPHLHFEIQINGTATNAMNYF